MGAGTSVVNLRASSPSIVPPPADSSDTLTSLPSSRHSSGRRMRMKYLLPLAFLATTTAVSAADEPLALHPDNPHYFLFRGKPTILVTSAEHYGAVLNR